jgi:hypothetical protein
MRASFGGQGPTTALAPWSGWGAGGGGMAKREMRMGCLLLFFLDQLLHPLDGYGEGEVVVVVVRGEGVRQEEERDIT